MNHLWRWKAFTIPGPLSSYGVGGPSWGSLFTIPDSYKPGMAFDSSLALLLGMLLDIASFTFDLKHKYYTCFHVDILLVNVNHTKV
jgi:hypothetical protein